MVISCVSIKGGAGKTTTSINLAVYFAQKTNKSICIIDSDINCNIEKWNKIRESQDIELSKIDYIVLNTDKDFKSDFDNIASKYDIILIDGRPAYEKMCALNMLVSDYCIIPFKPSPLDLWCNDSNFLDLWLDVKEKNKYLKGFFLLNECNSRAKLTDEIKKELKGLYDSTGIGIIEQTIDNRTIYRESLMYGCGVMELKDYKAIGEIIYIGDEIIKLLNI